MSQPTATTRPRRCWFSYSLRSLFVLITAVSLLVGWVAFERRQSRHELELAEQLKANGGYVFVSGLFDPADSSGDPSWWRRGLSGLFGPRILGISSQGGRSLNDLSSLARLTVLERLNLDGTQVSDLSPLAGLTRLERLSLDGTQVSDISPLVGLTRLKLLRLDSTQVSDISPLAQLRHLEELQLCGSQVSDISPLASLKNLRKLNVQRIPLSEEQIGLLHDALPNCKIESDAISKGVPTTERPDDSR